MVEAHRPEYLHSYFFYDRSLMALVAGYLLDIPRGVSCYADHLLKDYELKVVPLHSEQCNIIIVTSERIKQELSGIAPKTDPLRILVKPNGIDTECFPRGWHTVSPGFGLPD
jgi:colanic acid/amylovoran biosynthesis glycosyltransferase